jgi:hypothetical protein
MLAWIGVAVTLPAAPVERPVTYSMSQEILSPSLVSDLLHRISAARVEE